MKTKIILILMIQMLSYQIWAGSISGVISYSGTNSGAIIIAAFSSPTLNADPINVVAIDAPGSYSLTGLEDGTYYVVSVKTNNEDQMLSTDPYGFWGTLDNLTPVVISGNNDVVGINITLIDGTSENPNPFAEYEVEPDEIIPLPEQTIAGNGPCIAFDGTSIYLYKHDSTDAPSGKIYVVNPVSGEVLTTHYLTLQSSPNKISWIIDMVFRNGDLWATGGYGDPLGTGYIEGLFKVDISTSTSSSQIKNSISGEENINGLGCDGTNFFIGIKSTSGEGIVKFNPDNASVIPSDFFITLDEQRLRHITYGDGNLWVGIDRINKFDPVTGTFLGDLELPGSASELYIQNQFWTYDERDNALKVYNQTTVGIDDQNEGKSPTNYSLSQN